MRKLLLNIASILSHWISKIHMPWSRKLITGNDVLLFMKHIEPGDILLTRSNGELSNIFVPGFWGHAAITGEDAIIEATTKGVHKSDPISFLMGKDYACALRPVFLDKAERSKAVEFSEDQIGKPYDYSFNTSNITAFYCSELVYMAMKHARNQIPFKLRSILGQETVDPSDFYRTSMFELVWESESLKTIERKL